MSIWPSGNHLSFTGFYIQCLWIKILCYIISKILPSSNCLLLKLSPCSLWKYIKIPLLYFWEAAVFKDLKDRMRFSCLFILFTVLHTIPKEYLTRHLPDKMDAHVNCHKYIYLRLGECMLIMPIQNCCHRGLKFSYILLEYVLLPLVDIWPVSCVC